jgi:phage FluMu protein Com
MCLNSIDRTPLTCAHSFCRSCLGSYISDVVASGSFTAHIKCPFTICDAKLTVDLMATLVAQETLQTFKTVRNSRVTLKTACPNPECQKQVELEHDTTSAICQTCFFEFCLSCYYELHPGRDCDSAKLLRDVLKAKDAGREPVQCPACKTVMYFQYIGENTSNVLGSCSKQDCGIDILVCCAVYRSSVTAHGLHYHRP